MRLVWFWLGFAGLAAAGLKAANHEVLLIVGAPGEDRFAEGFDEAAEAWKDASKAAKANLTIIGNEETPGQKDKENIRGWIQELDTEAVTPAWIVYIGHGTYNRRDAYLNLHGPDLSAKEMQSWLPAMNRTLVFIHGGSAGSPFLQALSDKNRILVSATRNPDEINYARFGEYFAEVIAKEDGDIDQDGQTSLLEAFLTTANRVDAFYKETGRLASEHSLIDDNGDALGTPPDWFRGVRVTTKAKGGQEPDGFRAHQIALIPSELEERLTPQQRVQRNKLEEELEALRKQKSDFEEDQYYEMLEAILLKLSEIYLHEDEAASESGILEDAS